MIVLKSAVIGESVNKSMEVNVRIKRPWGLIDSETYWIFSEGMIASELKMKLNMPIPQGYFTRGVSHSGFQISASSNVNPFTGELELLCDVLADHEGGKLWEKKIHFILTTFTVGMSDEFDMYIQRFQ